MERIEEQRELLTKMMDMLEEQFPDSEIVLHDFNMPYEHTIVDIRNGHITGRKIGGCLTNFGLDVVQGSQEGMDKYNYITYLPSATILRSSSMYFTNSDGKAIGSLCINTDITEECRYREYLNRKVHLTTMTAIEERSEVLPDNVQDLLEHLIEEAQHTIGKTAEQMSKDDKVQFLEYLDSKGAMLISKSGERICAYLGISKYSLYKYLEIVRNKSDS